MKEKTPRISCARKEKLRLGKKQKKEKKTKLKKTTRSKLKLRNEISPQTHLSH